MNDLLESTCEHEGFESKPYQDHLGNWTFGHGLTYITEEESKYIVRARLDNLQVSLMSIHTWIGDDPPRHGIMLDITTEMAYQMGLTGCLNFKNMWKALEDSDYSKAADEMLDSNWAKQTPNRANEMANIIRELA